MNYYLEVIRKYAKFEGRAGRKEYWYFTLFYNLILIALIVVDNMIGPTTNGFGVLSLLYMLALILPYVAATVRRLHDTGRSGSYYLIGFIPFVGWLILLVFLAQGSHPDPNKYGANPNEATEAVDPAANDESA